MKQYLDLVRLILETGSWQDNRTGVRTLSIPGAMMRFDLLNDGFPAITTRKLAFKSAIGELVGFLRASRSAADFRALGCKVWDQNANENAQWLANPYRLGTDDLGEVYGRQWRAWPAYKVLREDRPAQIEDALARGYRIVARIDDDGHPAALLYKAVDQLRHVSDKMGGFNLYLAKNQAFALTERDRAMWDEFRGDYKAMAHKHGITEVRARQIIDAIRREELARRQGRLDLA